MVTANLFSLKFVVTAFFLSPWAHAINLSPCSKPKLQNFKNIIKVAIVEKDDRQTYADYAKSKGVPLETINQKYGATGMINCDGFRGSAQITGDNSTITTSGHTFFDKKCNPRSFKGCHFAIKEDGKESRIAIKLETLMVGKCDHANVEHDWAVVKLARPVIKSIAAYQTPPSSFQFRGNQPVVQASGYSSTFKAGGKNPRHLLDCQIRDVAVFDGYPLQTDCDASPGSSGSAQLIESPNGPTVIGIVSNDVNQADGTSYDKYKAFNLSTPVRGAFLEAIKAAVAETGGGN